MSYSWMLGVFLFALLLGQIRDIVSNASKARDRYRQTIDSALQQMKALKLPQPLQEKVLVNVLSIKYVGFLPNIPKSLSILMDAQLYLNISSILL